MTPIGTLILVVLAIIWIAPWSTEARRYCGTDGCMNRVVPPCRFQWRTKIILTLVFSGLIQVIRIIASIHN